MSVEKQNLEAIRKKYPKLYQKLTNVKDTGRYKLIKPNASGYPNILDTQTNKLLYDNANPMKDVFESVKDRKIKVPNFAVFLGAGMFYTIKSYVDIYINQKVSEFVMYIIEKDLELFKAVIKHVNLVNIINHNNCILDIGSEPFEIHMNMTNMFTRTSAKSYLKAINFIEDVGPFVIHKDYYLNCMKAIREASKDVLTHYGNCPNDSLIGIDNTFVNIDEIVKWPGIKDLKDKFKGKPGVVVSTGPSLSKNIDLLKGLENKAVIACPDASMQVMKSHGLKPHLVTSLERVPNSAKLFDNIDENDAKDVYFSGVPVLHPLTYKNWPGERIVVYRAFATFEWLDVDKGVVDIGPSAGNMAFELLEYLGCDPIILIGQDLAFSDDDKTHAKGSRFGEKEERPVYKQTLMVPGNYKPEVKTIRVWETFRRAYVRAVNRTNSKVINATEGGAKIEGTELMTFQEAINQYINKDVDTLSVIRENLNKPDAAEIKEVREKIMQKVNDGITYLEDISSQFIESAKLTKEYFDVVWKNYKETGEYDFEKATQIVNTTSKALSLCNSREFYLIVMHYVQAYYIKSVIDIYGARASSKTKEEEQFEVLKIGNNFFVTMHGLLGKMIPMFYNLKKYLEDKAKEEEQ